MRDRIALERRKNGRGDFRRKQIAEKLVVGRRGFAFYYTSTTRNIIILSYYYYYYYTSVPGLLLEDLKVPYATTARVVYSVIPNVLPPHGRCYFNVYPARCVVLLSGYSSRTFRKPNIGHPPPTHTHITWPGSVVCFPKWLSFHRY